RPPKNPVRRPPPASSPMERSMMHMRLKLSPAALIGRVRNALLAWTAYSPTGRRRQAVAWSIYSLRASERTSAPAALLQEPTSVLLGVSNAAADALKRVGINTVFDLASSELFARARNITLLAEDGEGSFAMVGRVPSDALHDGADKPLSELPGAAISMLVSSVSPAEMDALAPALDAAPIHDMAVWPPYRTARELLDRVYNPLPPPGALDAGTPPDLLPANGQYPTERVQYEVLLFDKFVGRREETQRD